MVIDDISRSIIFGDPLDEMGTIVVGKYSGEIYEFKSLTEL